MEYKKYGNAFVIRADRGDEIMQILRTVAKGEGIRLASVTAIGAVNRIRLAVYDVENRAYTWNTYEGVYELSSLSGTVTEADGEPYLHIHASASGRDNMTVGGHLGEAVVSGTCEIVVTAMDGQAGRKYDDGTGLNIMDL